VHQVPSVESFQPPRELDRHIEHAPQRLVRIPRIQASILDVVAQGPTRHVLREDHQFIALVPEEPAAREVGVVREVLPHLELVQERPLIQIIDHTQPLRRVPHIRPH